MVTEGSGSSSGATPSPATGSPWATTSSGACRSSTGSSWCGGDGPTGDGGPDGRERWRRSLPGSIPPWGTSRPPRDPDFCCLVDTSHSSRGRTSSTCSCAQGTPSLVNHRTRRTTWDGSSAGSVVEPLVPPRPSLGTEQAPGQTVRRTDKRPRGQGGTRQGKEDTVGGWAGAVGGDLGQNEPDGLSPPRRPADCAVPTTSDTGTTTVFTLDPRGVSESNPYSAEVPGGPPRTGVPKDTQEREGGLCPTEMVIPNKTQNETSMRREEGRRDTGTPTGHTDYGRRNVDGGRNEGDRRTSCD